MSKYIDAEQLIKRMESVLYDFRCFMTLDRYIASKEMFDRTIEIITKMNSMEELKDKLIEIKCELQTVTLYEYNCGVDDLADKFIDYLNNSQFQNDNND